MLLSNYITQSLLTNKYFLRIVAIACSNHSLVTALGYAVINDKIGRGKFIVRRIRVGEPVQRNLCSYGGGPWRVYARKLLTIRAVTYNIGGRHSGFRADRVTAVLQALDADVVCLQEVAGESADNTQAHALASRLRMNCVFAPAHAPHPVGNAMLCRWPLHSVHRIPLPRAPSSSTHARKQHRVALAAVVSPFRHRPHFDFWCLCTQLSAYSSKDQASGACTKPLACLRDFVQHPTRKDMPALLLADLNAAPGGKSLGFLDRNWNVYSQYDTCFTTSKQKLDHILDRSRGRWVAGKQWVVPNAVSVSGHLPLVSEFHVVPE